MILLIAVYLLLVFVLPLALSLSVSYRSLPRGIHCPQCAGESWPILARTLTRLSAITPARLQRRWCPACGWEGVVRFSGQRQLAGGTRTWRDADPASNTCRHSIDVRCLTVNGVPWRVRLEYWRQTGRSCGRLVFIEPSGRIWPDARPLRGRTDRDLLGQALSFSDGLLASRLRELVSD